jgi:hypothetical protein
MQHCHGGILSMHRLLSQWVKVNQQRPEAAFLVVCDPSLKDRWIGAYSVGLTNPGKLDSTKSNIEATPQ